MQKEGSIPLPEGAQFLRRLPVGLFQGGFFLQRRGGNLHCQLAVEISAAPLEKKAALEEAYREAAEELRALREGD